MGGSPVKQAHKTIDEKFRAGMKKAFERYHDTHSLCRAEGCRWGYVVVDPTDIDSYTNESRTSPCPTCKGKMFVPDQLEMFPDYKAAPENE